MIGLDSVRLDWRTLIGPEADRALGCRFLAHSLFVGKFQTSFGRRVRSSLPALRHPKGYYEKIGVIGVHRTPNNRVFDTVVV